MVVHDCLDCQNNIMATPLDIFCIKLSVKHGKATFRGIPSLHGLHIHKARMELVSWKKESLFHKHVHQELIEPQNGQESMQLQICSV